MFSKGKMTMIKQILKAKKGILLFFGLMLSVLYLQSGSASAATIDLKSYYPNPSLSSNYYLEGFNHRDPNATPTRSVLWFEKTNQNGEEFKRYNSGPEDPTEARCSWDLLSWAGDNLTYAQTHNDCGTNNKDVIYDQPILFLPRYWDDQTVWTYNGTTPVTTTKLNGDPGCTGVNTYTSRILGRTEVTPGVMAIQWRTNQTINWSTGNDLPDCVAGGVTNWQEDYYMIENIPVENYQGLTSALGLKRTVGGNADNYTNTGLHDWDIWFDKWVKLPWMPPLSVVTDPVTPNPTSPKTGILDSNVLKLAVLGGITLLLGLGLMKTYSKKKKSGAVSAK